MPVTDTGENWVALLALLSESKPDRAAVERLSRLVLEIRPALDNVRWLRDQTELPICIGFGISQAEHVKMLAPVADGVIVGSALVRRIAEVNPQSRQECVAELGQFAAHLMSALGSS